MNAGIVAPVFPSFLNKGNAPLLPFVSAFSGEQPRGSIFDRLVPDLPPDDFIKLALTVTVHPMARPCPLPNRLVDTIVSAAKLADNLVAHRWSLFRIVLEKKRELSAARKTWKSSLSGDSLALFGSWDFPLFQRLLDEAGYEDKHLLHDISCLPLIGLAPVSGVLSPKSVHATVSLSQFFSKVPQRNVEVFNRVGPTGDSELDRRASAETHEEFALVLMDGPYNSLEECPGEHKVLVRRKPCWQSGDVRNIDDCSENGINETFESKKRHTNLPVLTTTFLQSSCGKLHFLASRFMGLLQICGNISGRLALVLNLIVVFWCHSSGSRKFGRLRGCPCGAAACVQGCTRLPMAMCALLQHHLLVPVQHYQDDHHCVEPSFSVAQAWTLIKQFYGLLGPKLATPGGEKFPFPTQIYRLLCTKVDLTVSPRKIQVLPSRVDSICCELKQILASKKLSKGHASEVFGKLSFSAGQLFGRFGRMHLAPFKLRQYGKNGSSHLTPEIERAIGFWLSFLPRGPFRAVPPHSGTPFVITMSDGEGTGSVAAAIWSPLAPGGVHQPRWFQVDLHNPYLQLGLKVRISSPRDTSTRLRPLFPAICLTTWPDLIRGSLWLHFIDNDGAQSCLVSGCSRNSSLSDVVDYTWAQIPGTSPCIPATRARRYTRRRVERTHDDVLNLHTGFFSVSHTTHTTHTTQTTPRETQREEKTEEKNT